MFATIDELELDPDYEGHEDDTDIPTVTSSAASPATMATSSTTSSSAAPHRETIINGGASSTLPRIVIDKANTLALFDKTMHPKVLRSGSGSRSPRRTPRDSGKEVTININEMEDDPEFEENLNEMIHLQQRRRSIRPGKMGRNLTRRRTQRGRSMRRESEGSGQSMSAERRGSLHDDYLDLYGGEDKGASKDDIRDNINLQQEIISGLRAQPWRMKRKLRTLGLAKTYVERHEGQLSRGRGYQEAGAKFWRRFKRELFNFISFFVPWEMRIKKIESHFGSVVASYFIFLRWLFWVNIILAVITMGFIVIPEFFFGEPFATTPRKSIPDNEIEKSLNLDTIWDFEGYLKHSVLFYGYYGNEHTTGHTTYRLPLAYFLAGMCTYAISFIIILRRMARNYRLRGLTVKDERSVFSWQVFTTWDYMIGTCETAKNKSADIATSFRESILEEQEKQRVENKYILVCLRMVAQLLVMGVLASSAYIIYLVVERSTQFEKDGKSLSWYERNEVTIVMTLITALYPSIFDVIGMMEKFHPRIYLRWQLARILVLYLLNLYTLIIALYNKVSGGKIECWETMIGQELMKLTALDALLTLAIITLVDFIRGLVVRNLNVYCLWDMEKTFPEYGEFKVAENILHLINNQAMIWLGTFFSPVLPTANLIKLVMMLYLRSWAVLVCNIPHERVFRASRSNNFYYGLLLVMLFLVSLPFIYLLVMLEPSANCGPFSGFSKSYDVLAETIEKDCPLWVNTALGYVASPGVILPVFLLLVMLIYYLVSTTRSLKEANRDLQVQLHYERTEERKKIYAIADARQKNAKDPMEEAQQHLLFPSSAKNISQRSPAADAGTSQTTSGAPQHQTPRQGVAPSDIRVVGVPGITAEKAAALRASNPNIKMITADEARRQGLLPRSCTGTGNILTAPPGVFSTGETRRLSNSKPPVAVVQGKQMNTNLHGDELGVGEDKG